MWVIPKPPVQVCIPVRIPGQPPQSVAVLGLQRSDMRLLAAAEKLGPAIAEAAATLAAAAPRATPAANGGPSTGAARAPAKAPLPNGTAKRTKSGAHSLTAT